MPLTLRGRLLAGVLVLVALGLAGTDIAAYDTLSSSLDTRADRQLDRTANALELTVSKPSALSFAEGVLRSASPGEADVAFLRPDHTVLAALPRGQATPQRAALTRALQGPTLGELMRRPNHPIRLDLAGTPYRVLYRPMHGQLLDTGPDAPLGGQPTSAVVVALSFSSDQDTLSRLEASEVPVTVVALLVLALLAVGVLRLGLRPLATMAATATAIAEGDTNRRVPVDGRRSEVARLAIALNRAFDERRRAEDRLRRFVADVSHELRTPMTSIRGWADLYFQGGLPGPDGVETALTRIAEDAGQVSRLVEELLLLARLDEQRPLASDPVDLGVLAGEVVEDARVIDPGRPIACHVAPDPPIVLGDADRLRQVIRNLVGNATQHTPAGTPVEVRVATEDTPEGRVVRLGVADRGPGIPPADQERIFERFFRADPSRNHQQAGSGLGLAIVQAIVGAHHGSVSLDSAPGAGTVFQVTLPAVQRQTVSQPSA